MEKLHEIKIFLRAFEVHTNRLRKAASDGALVRRVEAIGASLALQTQALKATQRLDDIASRLKSNIALRSESVGAASGGSIG